MIYSIRFRPGGVRYGSAPVNGKIAALRLEDSSPDGGRRFIEGESAPSQGRRLLPDNEPTRARWRGPGKMKMPDFEDSYFINVSERARTLIEQLEPGRHQFFPIDYERKSGTLVERRYMFVICNRIDSVDRAQTTLILWRGKLWSPARELRTDYPDDIPPDYDWSQPSRLVFNAAQSQGYGIWRDKHLDVSILASAAVAEAIRAAQLTGIEFVEKPWV